MSEASLGQHLEHVWGIIWGMSGASSGTCLRQHLGNIVNNGQQFAVLHASVMPFLQDVHQEVSFLPSYYLGLFPLIHLHQNYLYDILLKIKFKKCFWDTLFRTVSYRKWHIWAASWLRILSYSGFKYFLWYISFCLDISFRLTNGGTPNRVWWSVPNTINPLNCLIPILK